MLLKMTLRRRTNTDTTWQSQCCPDDEGGGYAPGAGAVDGDGDGRATPQCVLFSQAAASLSPPSVHMLLLGFTASASFPAIFFPRLWPMSTNIIGFAATLDDRCDNSAPLQVVLLSVYYVPLLLGRYRSWLIAPPAAF